MGVRRLRETAGGISGVGAHLELLGSTPLSAHYRSRRRDDSSEQHGCHWRPFPTRPARESILICNSFFGVAVGTTAVAFLADIGGSRLPFYIVGALLVAVSVLQWYSFPTSPQKAQTLSFFAHFKESRPQHWPLVCAGGELLLSNGGFKDFRVSGCLPHSHIRDEAGGHRALPLAVVGTGAMLGSLVGGYVAARTRRLTWSALALLLGGGCVGVALTVSLSPWAAIIFVLRQCLTRDDLRISDVGVGGRVRG
jgi:predicted MFS family arabinose efflux permease